MIVRLFRQWRSRRAAFRAALAFNRHHTYAGATNVGGMWQCPDCGRRHHCISWSAFTGRNFPDCCGFKQGHRLDRRHATGL
jgi:hypothetical protein